MTYNHGSDWHEELYDGESLAKLALKPSRIYSKAVVDMNGGFMNEPKAYISGVAHITGGGLPGKLGRILKKSGLGADIFNPFNPSPLMHYCQEKGNVSDEVAYEAWNMGQGMAILTPESDKVIEVANNHGIEAKVIGVVDEKQGVRIKSKGTKSYNSYLTFNK